MKKIFLGLFFILSITGCGQSKQEGLKTDFDSGYKWASDNDIKGFDDCQEHFGTSDAEDGCNKYIKANYTGEQTFKGYPCSEGCAGHKAGYDWAESKSINSRSDCKSKSQSFNEGCWSWVDENS